MEKFTPEERESMTTVVAAWLAMGYNRTRRRIPNTKEFEKVMLEVIDQIMQIQSKAGIRISVVGAGLALMLPDPNHPMDRGFRDLVKAGIVWYLLQQVPDVAKEFGLDKLDLNLDNRKN